MREKLKWLPGIGLIFGLKWFHEKDSLSRFLWEIYQYTSIVIMAWIFS
jgi:hypothetical protein